MIGTYLNGPYVIVKFLTDQENVPKDMGLFGTAMAVGTLLGPVIAGFFADRGSLALAVNITAILPFVGAILILIAMPKMAGNTSIKFDGLAAAIMPIAVILFVFIFDRLPELGWTNPIILVGLLALILLFGWLFYYENRKHKRGETPLIPVHLFKDKNFTALILVGIACFCYLTPLLSYSSTAAYELLNANSQIVGLFPLPRTILTILLPVAVGAWAGKKQSNLWKSILMATVTMTIAFIPLMFLSTSSSVLLFFFTFAMCGISEPFRAVSITPAAQQNLSSEELAAGTALINFGNSLSSVISASFATYLYGISNNPATGFRLVFTMLTVIAFAGIIITLFINPKKQHA